MSIIFRISLLIFFGLILIFGTLFIEQCCFDQHQSQIIEHEDGPLMREAAIGIAIGLFIGLIIDLIVFVITKIKERRKK